MASTGAVRTTVSVGGQREVDQALSQIRRSFEQMRSKTDEVASSMDRLQRASAGMDVVTRHARESARAMGILADTAGRATARIVDDSGQATRAFSRWQAGIERLHHANEAAGRRSAFSEAIRDMTGRELPAAEARVQSFGERLRGMAGQGRAALGGISAGFGGVALAIGGAVVAVRTLISVVDRATDAFHRLVQRGGEVSDVAGAFERIASPTLLGRLEAASAGLMTNVELMAGATQALRTGLVDQADIVRWTAAVTEAAQAMGRDVPQAYQAMIQAISGGRLEGLRALGVNLATVRDELRTMGLSMETERGRVAALDLAIAQLSADAEVAGGSSVDLDDAWTAVGNTLRNWIDEIARAVAQSQPLIDFFQSFRASLEESLPPGQEFADIIVRIAGEGIVAAQGLTRALIPLVTVVGRFLEFNFRIQSVMNPSEWFTGYSAAMAEAIDASIEGLGDLDHALTAGQEAFDDLEVALRDGQRELGGLVSATGRASDGLDGYTAAAGRAGEATESLATRVPSMSAAFGDVDRSARAAAVGVDVLRARLEHEQEVARGAGFDPIRQISGIAAPTAPREEDVELRRRIAEQHARLMQERKQFEDQQARSGRGGRGRDRAVEAARRELEILQQIAEAYDRIKTADEERTRAAEEAAAASRDRLREWWAEQDQHEIDASERRTEMFRRIEEAYDRDKAAAAEALEATQTHITETIGAITGIAGSVSGLWQSVSQILEAADVSTTKRAKAEGAFMVAYSSVQALIEVAAAIQAFANQKYTEGAEHTLAAAAYTTAAVAAGIRLGGGTKAASAPATTSFSRAEPARPSESGRGEGVTIINEYSLGRTEAGLGRELERATWERRRQGLTSPHSATVEYDA